MKKSSYSLVSVLNLLVCSLFLYYEFISIRSILTKENHLNRITHDKILSKTKIDTSIIIISSLIPTHPSIKMINDTFNSLSIMLNGLPPDTPIFISIDGLIKEKYQSSENVNRLQGYLERLRLRFRDYPHVSILNHYVHGHINHSIRRALEVVQTKFIYVIQHDFKFIKRVDHVALVKSMREHPEELGIIRFSKKRRGMGEFDKVREECKKSFHWNGIDFIASFWSDNNHFTTKSYYEKLLKNIGSTPRSPESPMMYGSESGNCSFAYQYLYNNNQSPFIKHLDGRQSKAY